jgi:hypothetical protein
VYDDDTPQRAKQIPWYKKASTVWVAFAAALAAFAAVASNITTLTNFALGLVNDDPLSLQLSDLRVEGSEFGATVVVTITKNIRSTARNCVLAADTAETYLVKRSEPFEIDRNVENDRRDFTLEGLPLDRASSPVILRVFCDGAVSNELRFEIGEDGEITIPKRL